MDFGQFTERARGAIQAAQMTALAGRHQNLLPEHLVKALLDDSDVGSPGTELEFAL